MKHLRRLCLIATLILTFACSTYAGDIECPVLAPPVEHAATREMNYPIAQALAILLSLV
jgi:hypothetical protein